MNEWKSSWLTANLYPQDVLRLAHSRGYDDEAHRQAIIADKTGLLDTDAVTLTHPFNWLTEEEVEAQPSYKPHQENSKQIYEGMEDY